MKLEIKVIPNAKKNEIINRDGKMVVKISAPAVNGKANDELVKFLSRYFKIKKSDINIIKGKKSRHKIISIQRDFPTQPNMQNKNVQLIGLTKRINKNS